MSKNFNIKEFVMPLIEEHELLLVDAVMDPHQRIHIYVDSIQGVTISQCARLSRKIEAMLEEVFEVFELSVSSPGLDQPFVIYEQYLKNIGREIYVVTEDGREYKGLLEKVEDREITIDFEKIEKQGKKKVKTREKVQLNISEIKTAKNVVSFK